jgi:hypothetical protein
MKSIILFLISMVILSGCNISLEPFGDNWGDSDGTTEYYKATISVRFENGNPCTTARAYFFNDYILADSTGTLRMLLEIEYESGGPRTQTFPCIVYKSWHKELIWEGNIELTGVAKKDSEWPDPFIEIVIPD